MRLNSPVGGSFNAVDPAHHRPKREANPDPEPARDPAAKCPSVYGRNQPVPPGCTRQTGRLSF